jgi:hypothetical protein
MAFELKKEKNILNKDSKMYFSGFDTLMAANDYLFTLAMKKLGCPDMPTSFGLDVCTNIQNTAKELDETIKQSYYNEEYSTKTYFDNQRKKDADDVRFKNKSLISTFKSSLGGTADQLAELVAEYQALKLRQDGHGAIWRFFHRTQNKERVELLEDMKSAITNAVGDNVNLDPKEKTPADIAALLNNKLIDKKGIEAFKPESFAKRSNSMDSIIYDPILKEGSISNQEKNKPNVNISENEKRVAVDFKGKEFIENNGEGLSPVVSNDSAIKNNKNLEK